MTFEAIVVGSGAGGAPAAARLAAKWGDGVALVEAGPHFLHGDFTQLEREMIPALYARAGLQGTEDGALSVLQGSCVGGSTVVNDAVCFRPPPEVEERWRAHGMEISLEALAPYVDEVERVMGVSQIPRSMVNRANYLVGLGAARLGWHGERLRHNSPGCVQCGFRHVGCAYDLKRSMNISFVPLALEAGCVLLADTRVSHLVRRDGHWEVHTDTDTLRAKRVVLAAGVVQTPAILLRSGIEAGEGVQFHVTTNVYGEFEERVDGFAGIPMSYGVFEFSDVFGHTGPGFAIEASNVQPLAYSVQPQFEGIGHEEALRRYAHMAGAIGLVRSAARGRVRLKGSRPAIDYPLVEADTTRLVEFLRRMTELFIAAGATRVLLPHRGTRWVTEPPGDLRMEAGWAGIYTPHPFGGANRGSVTDAVGRVRDEDDLWVLDGSAIPEAIGVNPQISIASLALEGADRILA